MEEKCMSCNNSLINDSGKSKFKCPNCNKQEMIRCRVCRLNAVKYKCGDCDFTGPN